MQRGFVVFFLTLVLFGVILVIVLGIALISTTQQRALGETIQSAKAYYAAESGVEDALLRLSKAMNWSNTYSFPVESTATVDVDISDVAAGTRTVLAEGNSSSRVRKVKIIYELSAGNAQFFYGAHIGEGGLRLSPNSAVFGNVFSNGDVIQGSNAGIKNTVEIAGAGHRISGGYVNDNAYVDVCQNTNVIGDLHANSSSGCGAFIPLGAPPASIPLPLSSAQIDQWKADAEGGGVIVGDYTVPFGGGAITLGPKKITGNLIVQNNAELILTGTLWVNGNVILNNNSWVHLHGNYGTTSGMIISDSVITLSENNDSTGSGQPGSYLMYISTSSANPAIIVEENVQVDILYAGNGWVDIANNASVREVNAYGIELGNNAGLYYEIGLQDVLFTNGPGGGWTVASWQEVE